MKKIITVIFIALMICMTFASAYEVYSSLDNEKDTTSHPADNFLGRLWSNFKLNSGLFTVYGQILKCEDYPSTKVVWTNADAKPINFVLKLLFPITTLLNSDKVTITAGEGEAFFVNWYRGSPDDGVYDHSDSRQYMGEYYMGKGGAKTLTLQCDASGYWNYQCYYEIYVCPLPCSSDADCIAMNWLPGTTCDKSKFSEKVTNMGVCTRTAYTHKTKAYSCSNGIKTYLGEFAYGSDNFCVNPSAKKYLIGTTDQCLTYIPTDCEPAAPTTCEAGLTKCEGTVYFTCSNNEWVNEGEVEGQCGINEECTSSKCEGTTYYTCVNSNYVNKGKVDGKCGYTEEENCLTDADINCDNSISDTEIIAYGLLWRQDIIKDVSPITRDQLGIAIEAWASE